MDGVELRPALPQDAATLANLLELYCHDLSSVFGLRLGPDGRFGYRSLPLYWQEPNQRFAFFIVAAGELTGFALATRGSPATSNPSHLDVAEFFVVRARRGTGIGERAAHLLWNRLPGHWVVRAAQRNQPACGFWRRTIANHAHGREREQVRELGGTLWNVFEFDSATA